MSDNQDRIKLKLTIEMDFAREDQPRIMPVLEDIIGNLSFSSSGNGMPTKNSSYSYKLESNQPSQPMTLDKMIELVDAHAAPGEPTASEIIAETNHPEFEQAEEWWATLSEQQQQWFIKKHPEIKLVTKAWEANKAMSFADKVFFQTLK